MREVVRDVNSWIGKADRESQRGIKSIGPQRELSRQAASGHQSRGSWLAASRKSQSHVPYVPDTPSDQNSSGKTPSVTLDTPMIDHVRAITVFASVVSNGSFRGAAKDLALAPSVVSHHVSSLERRLRVVLLHRSTRKLSLTAEGKRLYEVTSAMLKTAEDAFHDIARRGDEPSGTIRVSLPAAAASGPLMQHLASFMRLYPRVHLAIHLSEDATNVPGSDYDIVLRVCWPEQTTKKMKKLYMVPGRLVASPDYMKQRDLPTHPSDLATWDWIRFSPRPAELEFSHPELGVVRVRGIERASVDSIAAIHKLVVSGIGVARLPYFVADPSIKSGQLVELLPGWTLTSPSIYAILPTQVSKTGILWKLYQHLSTNAAETELVT